MSFFEQKKLGKSIFVYFSNITEGGKNEMPQKKHVDTRISQEEHEELKRICQAHNTTICKVLNVLTTLFLSDFRLQARVLKECERIVK